MPWAKVDDLYDDKRKVRRAWRADPRTIGLHIMAITYTTRHQLDGRVPDDWLEEMIPKTAVRREVLAILVEHRLFDRDERGYVVHDYLDWNPSAAHRGHRREAASAAAAARWASKNGANRKANSKPNGNANCTADSTSKRNAT